MNKNTFAQTPPMGWNSYDYYDTSVNEEQVKANALYMASNLKKSGWEYIVVDIEWYSKKAGSMRDKYQYIPFGEVEIDEYSRLLPDPERFPSSVDGAGFKHLADYVHSLGLKFGIHIMRGIPRIAAHNHMAILGSPERADEIADPANVCFWNPDMYGLRPDKEGSAKYYESIISLYASWGVDFIKCDDICRMDQPSCEQEIIMIHNAIMKTKRPIVLSLSPGAALIDKAWHYETYANMWRITDDFWDNWELLKEMFYRCELWQEHISEGCFPDCDMLPVGMLGKGFGCERMTGFTFDEQRTMITLWCIFGSPLMIGGELTKLDDKTLELLTNDEVLKMLTPACKPHQVIRNDKEAVWTAFNPDTGLRYIALFNLSDETNIVSVDLDKIWPDSPSQKSIKAKEIWNRKEKAFTGMIEEELSVHACAVYVTEEN